MMQGQKEICNLITGHKLWPINIVMDIVKLILPK